MDDAPSPAGTSDDTSTPTYPLLSAPYAPPKPPGLSTGPPHLLAATAPAPAGGHSIAAGGGAGVMSSSGRELSPVAARHGSEPAPPQTPLTTAAAAPHPSTIMSPTTPTAVLTTAASSGGASATAPASAAASTPSLPPPSSAQLHLQSQSPVQSQSQSQSQSQQIPPKRGAPPNTVVQAAFTRFQKEGFKTDFARCRYCGKERAWHTTDLQKHLLKCEAYRLRFPDAEPAFRRKRRREGSGVGASGGGGSSTAGPGVGRAGSTTSGGGGPDDEEEEVGSAAGSAPGGGGGGGGAGLGSADTIMEGSETESAQPRLRRVETLLRQVLGGQETLGAKVEELGSRLGRLERRVGGLQTASAGLYGGLAQMAIAAQREVGPEGEDRSQQRESQQPEAVQREMRILEGLHGGPVDVEQGDRDAAAFHRDDEAMEGMSTYSGPSIGVVSGGPHQQMYRDRRDDMHQGRLIQPRPPGGFGP